MQKLFLLVVICLASCGSDGGNGEGSSYSNGVSSTVYLCNGPQSKVYHKTSHCQGLRRCSTEIEAVDITTAKARHRRECGYCYR